MKPCIKKKSNYSIQRHSFRAKVLKHLHCRRMLILICTLVVLECMCVMAELMVDLQGIRVRFDNEEEEVTRFVQFMKSKNPSAFANFEGKTLEDLMHMLRKTTTIWGGSEAGCNCMCDGFTSTSDVTLSDKNRTKRSVDYEDETTSSNKHTNRGDHSSVNVLLHQLTPVSTHTRPAFKDKREKFVFQRSNTITNGIKLDNRQSPKKRLFLEQLLWHPLNRIHYELNARFKRRNKLNQLLYRHNRFHDIHKSAMKIQSNSKNEKIPILMKQQMLQTKRTRRDIPKETNTDKSADIFVFSVHNGYKDFYMVSEFLPWTQNEEQQVLVNGSGHNEQYERIHTISHVIKYCGFCILTIMLCETLVKFACLGLGFLKKKIEVFDAFIVIVSFTLDVIFIDSKWYETRKDATTILVLLLPWRVVRIVNSFLMTINHKHYIEMMTVRRAKKKNDIKLKKLERLMVEMRRDIDLLIDLGKAKGASEPEIAACIYGKGRGSSTLAAITSFASLMFISTLGKKDPSHDDTYDDMYGDLIRDILEDDDEETFTEKVTNDDTREDKDDDEIEYGVEHINTNGIYSVSRSFSGKQDVSKCERMWKAKRRVTLPRRHASCTDDDTTVYYVNDGYVTGDEGKCNNDNMYSKSSVKSMPLIGGTSSGNNLFVSMILLFVKQCLNV